MRRSSKTPNRLLVGDDPGLADVPWRPSEARPPIFERPGTCYPAQGSVDETLSARALRHEAKPREQRRSIGRREEPRSQFLRFWLETTPSRRTGPVFPLGAL